MFQTQQMVLSNDDIIKIASAAGATHPIQSVSDKYSFVSTMTAVDILRSTGWVPVEARQSKTRKEERSGFQKHMIRFMKEGLVFGKDNERVDIMLINSHDRGAAFKLTASVWRQICGNGLIVAAPYATFSHRHMGFDELNFEDSALKITNSAGLIAEQVDNMRAVDLTPDERGVYALAAHSLVYEKPESAPIKPNDLLTERRYDDNGGDLWSTFNVVQENILKGGLRGYKRGVNGRVRRVRTRAVKSIDRDIKLNRSLWVLTEKMHELHTAKSKETLPEKTSS